MTPLHYDVHDGNQAYSCGRDRLTRRLNGIVENGMLCAGWEIAHSVLVFAQGSYRLWPGAHWIGFHEQQPIIR